MRSLTDQVNELQKELDRLRALPSNRLSEFDVRHIHNLEIRIESKLKVRSYYV
jgi:hypothetical protein